MPKYTRLEIFGNSLDEVYDKMKKTAEVSGCKIECPYNDKVINSDMTRDEAYIEYFGKTRDEVMREQEEHQRDLLKHKEEFELSRDEKTAEYKELGAKLISPDLLPKWNETVDNYMRREMYSSMLPIALDMIERARNGATNKELIRFLNQLDCSVYVKDIAVSTAERYGNDINGLCSYVQAYRTMKDTPSYSIYPSDQEMPGVDRYLQSRDGYVAYIMANGPSIVGEKYMQPFAELMVGEEKGTVGWHHVMGCLAIVEELNDGTSLDDVKDLLDRHNLTSYGDEIVVREAVRLCDRGREFADYVKELQRSGPVIGE